MPQIVTQAGLTYLEMIPLQEFLQAAIVRLDVFLLTACDLLQANEPLISDIPDTLESLPPLFELLWQHRHIVFRATRSDANGELNGKTSMLSDVQCLIGRYCDLYRHAFP